MSYTAGWVTNESGRTVSGTSFFNFDKIDIDGERKSPFLMGFNGTLIEVGKLLNTPDFGKVIDFIFRELEKEGVNINLHTKVLHCEVDRYKCVIINKKEYREKGGLVYSRRA